MSERLCRTLQCELPIQLAPMGSVSASARLPLAVAATGAHAMYLGLALSAGGAGAGPRRTRLGHRGLRHQLHRPVHGCGLTAKAWESGGRKRIEGPTLP